VIAVNAARVVGNTIVSMLQLPPRRGVAVRQRSHTEPRTGVLLPLRGTTIVRLADGLDRVIRGGQVLIMSGHYPAALYSDEGASLMRIDVPLPRRESLGDWADLDGLLVLERSAIREPMEWFLRAVLKGPEPLPSPSEHSIEYLIREMVQSLFVEHRGGHPHTTSAEDGPLRALNYIAANATDPALRPSVVARELNVSVRQLQRWFEREGTTPSAEIRRQRLTVAVAHLTATERTRPTIHHVAHAAGFTDDAALRRALRALGQPAPSRLPPNHLD
jgi:AraC-like DNA-binding protein